jgi:hypothetical protein
MEMLVMVVHQAVGLLRGSSPLPAQAIAQENITIQNNRFLNNVEEGVVFTYNNRRRSTPSAS